MLRPLALVFVLAFTTVARADAPRESTAPAADPADAGVYVGFGVLAGTNHFSYSGAMFQAGSRFGSLPVFARFTLSGGMATTWNDSAGWYVQTRVGLEFRHCFTTTCAFVGIDTGLVNARYDAPDDRMTTEEALGFLGVARAGVELPAGPIRFRIAAEATTLRTIFSAGSADGLAVDLAAVHTF